MLTLVHKRPPGSDDLRYVVRIERHDAEEPLPVHDRGQLHAAAAHARERLDETWLLGIRTHRHRRCCKACSRGCTLPLLEGGLCRRRRELRIERQQNDIGRAPRFHCFGDIFCERLPIAHRREALECHVADALGDCSIEGISLFLRFGQDWRAAAHERVISLRQFLA